MTHKRFNEIVKEETARIEKILVKKQAEYNLDKDRLSHFKRAAVLAQETPEKVLYGYMLKHIMSVSDMVASEKEYSKEVWVEKMTDIHCYLILLLGLLEDDNMFLDKLIPNINKEALPKKATKVRLNEGKKK